MDPREAKEILQGYRPSGADAEDEHFREALEAVARDPELAAWLEEERAFDEGFAAKLAEVPVPPQLKEDILAGEKVVEFPGFWRRPAALAAVAAVLLAGVFSVAVLFPGPEPAAATTAMSWQQFQQGAVGYYEGNTFQLKKMTPSQEEAHAWLARHGAPSGFGLPPAMEGQPSMGCTVFEMDGHPVSLVCFKMDGDLVHVFGLRRDAVENPPPLDKPVFAQDGDWSMASWSEGDLSLMLTSQVPMSRIRQLMSETDLTAALAPRR
ncbi:MAG: hypothetical protein AAGK14_00240 [Verrucomicrobiota bacterium]